MPIRTVLDSCVVIAAFEADEPASERAIEILADPEREFIVSDILRLELLPGPTFHALEEKRRFMERFFDIAVEDVPITPDRTAGALEIATSAGLTACDALHLEVARASEADEFITTERPTAPFFRWARSPVGLISIHPTEEAAAGSAAPPAAGQQDTPDGPHDTQEG